MAITPNNEWVKTESHEGAYFNAVKYDEGGSIWDQISKADATDEPTLVIGIGGLGNKTVDMIKGECVKRINDKKRKIRFLAVDTCADDLNQLEYLNDKGKGTGEEKIFFLPPANGQFLRFAETVKDPVNRKSQAKWMDPQMGDSDLDFNGKGAGRCRQMGRLYLSIGKCYQDICGRLASIFNDFNTNFKDQIPRVILIAGVCSGTGSGCILDISYLISKIAKNILHGNWQGNLNAFIYAPVPSANRAGDYDGDEALFKNHFIAAMKEINNFIKSDVTNNEYTFEHDNGVDTSRKSIFKSCTIVQGHGGAAGALLTLDEVRRNVADFIVSSLSKFEVANQDYTSISSAIDGNVKHYNKDTCESLTRANPNLPIDTGYNYRAMGFKTVRYPIQEIITVLCNSALKELEDLYCKDDKIDAEDYLKDLGILPHGAPSNTTPKYPRLNKEGNRYLWFDQLFKTQETAAYSSIKQKVDRYLPARKNKNNVKNYIDIGIDAVQFNGGWASTVYETISGNLRKILKVNPYQAKFLLQDILYGTDGDIGILDWMKTNQAQAKQDLMAFQTAAEKRCKTIKDNLGFFSISDDDYNMFRRCALDVAWAKWRIRVWDKMYNELSRAYELLKEEDNTLYKSLVTLFSTISDIVGKDSSAMLKATEAGAGKNRSFIPMFDIAAKGSMSPRLTELMKYTLKDNDDGDENSFVKSFAKRLMAKILHPDNIDKLNISDSTKFMLAVDEVKETISKLLDESIKNLVMNILIVFYTAKENNPGLDRSIPVDAVLKILNDTGTYMNPHTGSMDYNAMANDFVATYHSDPFEITANAIFNEMCGATLCASLTGAGVVEANISDYKVFTLMKRAGDFINEKIKNKIMAKFGIDESHISEVDDNYTYVQVYAGIPMYAFLNMEEYHKAYTAAVNKGEYGLHMSYESSPNFIPWSTFPPMVNDLALKIIESGGNAYLHNPTYKEEIKVLTDVKADADAIDSNGFFTDSYDISGKLDYYKLQYLIDYTVVNDTIIEEMVNAYKADIQNAVALLQMPPMSNNDPVGFYMDSIKGALTKSIYDYLTDAGITFAEREITPGAFGLAITDNGYTREKDATDSNNGFGGFYRTLRYSSDVRHNMKEIRSMCEKIQKKFNDAFEEIVPIVTQNKTKEFWIAKEAKEIEKFIEAIGNDFIKIELDKNNIMVSDVLSGNGEVFNTMRAYEKDYLLYSVYAGWFTIKYRFDAEYKTLLDGALAEKIESAAETGYDTVEVYSVAKEKYHNNAELQHMINRCGFGADTPAKALLNSYAKYKSKKPAFFSYDDDKSIEENEKMDPLFINVHLGESVNLNGDRDDEKSIVKNLLGFYDAVDNL